MPQCYELDWPFHFESLIMPIYDHSSVAAALGYVSFSSVSAESPSKTRKIVQFYNLTPDFDNIGLYIHIPDN